MNVCYIATVSKWCLLLNVKFHLLYQSGFIAVDFITIPKWVWSIKCSHVRSIRSTRLTVVMFFNKWRRICAAIFSTRAVDLISRIARCFTIAYSITPYMFTKSANSNRYTIKIWTINGFGRSKSLKIQHGFLVDKLSTDGVVLNLIICEISRIATSCITRSPA